MFFYFLHKGYPRQNTLAVAPYCRALPGLSLLLALPKRRQKASALSLGDPPTACRLNGTKLAFGSDNIPFHAACTGWVPRLRNLCTESQRNVKTEDRPCKSGVSQRR
ncbi:hypothetical protein D0T84_20170 [Dysgonomonas sp. 521]|nr:hypothetical protein [Dysgonomonas sp. 521]